jgi:hypothetical protein
MISIPDNFDMFIMTAIAAVLLLMLIYDTFGIYTEDSENINVVHYKLNL